MARRRWRDLSPRTRQVIVVGTGVEAALKAAALIDLSRRPAERVHGSKAGWAIAITLINSGGIVPVVYFRRGRHN